MITTPKQSGEAGTGQPPVDVIHHKTLKASSPTDLPTLNLMRTRKLPPLLLPKWEHPQPLRRTPVRRAKPQQLRRPGTHQDLLSALQLKVAAAIEDSNAQPTEAPDPGRYLAASLKTSTFSPGGVDPGLEGYAAT